MVQGLAKLGKSGTVRAPTNLKENYRPERKELANAIRALAMDAVQKAKSGHPGAPMGMADIAEVLWNGYLRHNPANPRWSNRDRFVMSNGHGSTLLYALLHLSGYDVTIEDLKHFRQLHSRTPGHPEFGLTPGIETTTGPLGQGLANGVGMALAERVLSAQFNREGFDIVDHYTYVAVGDGCLMEGISHEACSLAGALGLGKLIVLYDDNQISIDGDVRGWFADDTRKRFESYRWQVLGAVDGHDAGAVAGALEKARTFTDKPSLVILATTIAYGAPQAGTAVCHGVPLGPEAVAAARINLDWPHAEFVIPGEIYAAWDGRARGAQLEAEWNALFARYRRAYPQLADEFERRLARRSPGEWEARARSFIAALVAKSERIATRTKRALRLRPAAPRASRRVRRPDRIQPHALEGRERPGIQGHHPAILRRQLCPLRCARIRHVGNHERDRSARGFHPLRRNLSRVLRLRAQRRPHGGADEGAEHLRLYP